jgi:hypothetical protein
VLIKPMTALISAVNNEYSKLKHGDTSGVSSANTAENTLQTTASHTEFAYKDQQQKGYNPGF